jgi:hypothetical protein
MGVTRPCAGATSGKALSPVSGDVGDEAGDARDGVIARVLAGVIDGDAPSAAPTGAQRSGGEGGQPGPAEPSRPDDLTGGAARAELVPVQHVQVNVQPPAWRLGGD